MLEEPPILTIKQDTRRPTEAQLAAFRDIPTGFVCDAMGGRGALDCAIQPIGGGQDIDCTAVGPALVADNGPEEILATMGALHMSQAGDIIVSAVRGFQGCAASGDQFCAMMKNKGVAGFVTDGQVRDYDGIVEVGLPVWCTGLSPNSPYSNGPARVGFGAIVGGVHIESGDLIVADRNGVVVVPFDQIDRVARRTAQIAELEVGLEAKVKAGFCDMPVIAEMIADGRAVLSKT